jgi:hypothetical protein
MIQEIQQNQTTYEPEKVLKYITYLNRSTPERQERMVIIQKNLDIYPQLKFNDDETPPLDLVDISIQVAWHFDKNQGTLSHKYTALHFQAFCFQRSIQALLPFDLALYFQPVLPKNKVQQRKFLRQIGKSKWLKLRLVLKQTRTTISTPPDITTDQIIQILKDKVFSHWT